jgi:hypothetical protein
MPKKDKHHQIVRLALEKDGWTITHDPLVVPVGTRKVNVDLGAERLLAAKKGQRENCCGDKDIHQGFNDL